jgi:hypothetical protein
MLILGLACTIGLGTVGCSKKDKDKDKDTARTDGGKPDKGGRNGERAGVIEFEVFPTKVILLKQGEKKEVPVSRKGKGLKSVDVKVDSPDPDVTVEGGSFKDAEKEGKILINVSPTAKPGKHTITVTAGDLKKTFDVEITKGGEVAPPVVKASTYKVSSEDVALKQGGSKDVTVTRTGADLKDEKLEVTSSDPKVTVKGGEFKGDAKETTLTIQAAKDAAAKEQTITIKAGDKTIGTIKVNVEKAGGKGASNARPRGDISAARGQGEFRAEASTVTHRETAWFTREL